MDTTRFQTGHTCEVVIPLEQIQTRLRHLAEEINRDYADCEELVLLVILQGSILFAADLMRHLSMPVYVECLRGASYHGGTVSSGQVDFENTRNLRQLRGKQVLIVEDILDTGRTLHAVITRLNSPETGVAEVRTCVLLNKRVEKVREVLPDYQAFEIGDVFVVGYGLDYQGLYRNLPCVCSLEFDAS